nr:10110_t:CDS:2 [Entrophospora candida]
MSWLASQITYSACIEVAIKNTAGIHVANLELNRVKDNSLKDKTKKLSTIAGITNWNEWVWFDEGVEKDVLLHNLYQGLVLG